MIMLLLHKNIKNTKYIESLEEARVNMVKGQIMPSNSFDEKIINTLITIPRHIFIPDSLKKLSYIDENIPVSPNRVLMRPVFFANLLRIMKVDEHSNVLNIACNTGYSAAVLSKLAKKVVALESNPDLASKANFCLNKLSIDNVIVISGLLTEGYEDTAPYDIIYIEGSVENVPERLFDQLAEGGRLVTVVKNTPYTGNATIFEKLDKKIYKRVLFDINIPVIEEFK